MFHHPSSLNLCICRKYSLERWARKQCCGVVLCWKVLLDWETSSRLKYVQWTNPKNCRGWINKLKVPYSISSQQARRQLTRYSFFLPTSACVGNCHPIKFVCTLCFQLFNWQTFPPIIFLILKYLGEYFNLILGPQRIAWAKHLMWIWLREKMAPFWEIGPLLPVIYYEN